MPEYGKVVCLARYVCKCLQNEVATGIFEGWCHTLPLPPATCTVCNSSAVHDVGHGRQPQRLTLATNVGHHGRHRPLVGHYCRRRQLTLSTLGRRLTARRVDHRLPHTSASDIANVEPTKTTIHRSQNGHVLWQ